MNIFHALVLGIVQGFTEFLPISSSAHLIIFPELLKWPEQPLVFDTTLHLGTAAALIIFFWRDLLKVYTAFVKDFFSKKLKISTYTKEAKFAFCLLLSTIPASVIGFLFGDLIESYFRGIVGVVSTLIFGSILMFVAEKYFSKSTTGDLLAKANPKKSLIIGFFQSLAIFPGVSRSGSTISSGMILGFSKEEAARFSFLASVPIILEAGIFQILKEPSQLLGASIPAIVVGFLSSFVVGILVIKFLLNYLKTKGLKVFIIYRTILVLFLLLILLL